MLWEIGTLESNTGKDLYELSEAKVYQINQKFAFLNKRISVEAAVRLGNLICVVQSDCFTRLLTLILRSATLRLDLYL